MVLSPENAKEKRKLQKNYGYGINFFIFAAHIPGKLNINADGFSRIFNKNTEWQLNPKIFFELLISITTQKLIFLQPE